MYADLKPPIACSIILKHLILPVPMAAFIYLLLVPSVLLLEPLTSVLRLGFCLSFDKCPDRSGGSSLRGRESPRWQLVEGRYKGNLAGEERRSIGGADVETLLKGASSPASFDELSKIRLKVRTLRQWW